jgi:hypothetical protein
MYKCKIYICLYAHVYTYMHLHIYVLIYICIPAGFHNDVYRFSPAANTWTALSPSGSGPSPRGSMGFAATPNGMLYVFGGYGSGNGRVEGAYTWLNYMSYAGFIEYIYIYILYYGYMCAFKLLMRIYTYIHHII